MSNRILARFVLLFFVTGFILVYEIDEQTYFEHITEISILCEELWFCPLEADKVEKFLSFIQTGDYTLDVFLRNISISLIGMLIVWPLGVFTREIKNRFISLNRSRPSWKKKVKRYLMDHFDAKNLPKLSEKITQLAFSEIKASKITQKTFDRILLVLKKIGVTDEICEKLALLILAKLNDEEFERRVIVSNNGYSVNFGQSL